MVGRNILDGKLIDLFSRRPEFGQQAASRLGDKVPPKLWAVGNIDLLSRRKIAVFSSIKCPANLAISSHSLAMRLDHPEVAVISGFQSPVEKDILHTLLKLGTATIVCSPTGIIRDIAREDFKQPLINGKLLILSTQIIPKVLSAKRAVEQNYLAAALADSAVICYASPGGKTEQLARELFSWDISVYTFVASHNSVLLAEGACEISPDFPQTTTTK